MRAAAIATTGYQPAVKVGRASPVAPPGKNQSLVNVMEALKEVNPGINGILDYTYRHKTGMEAIAGQLPRFALTPGKPPEMIANFPKIVGLAQTHAYADDVVGKARQIASPEKEKYLKEAFAEIHDADQEKMLLRVLKERKVVPKEYQVPK